MLILKRVSALLILAATLVGCSILPHAPDATGPTLPSEVRRVPPKVALVLGGGAARGFAHIGVIKALEAQGITPDIVVGTSAGSLVGALYAAGYGGFDLQRAALQFDESFMTDWSLPDRGFIKGEALQTFVNQAVQQRPLEKLNKRFAVVVTDLQSGEQTLFRVGNTGMAVRASSSVPGVFQPVTINGHEYVDGGLTSPVPVHAARSMGADVIIAVDISNVPRFGATKDSFDIVLQSFAIMGKQLAGNELADADIVIRPETGAMRSTDFNNRNLAIMEGEKAALAAIPSIKEKIAAMTRTVVVSP
jgi:NTE family protein